MLADYVLALIRTDAPAEEIKRNSVENLEDFLHERMYNPCGALYMPLTVSDTQPFVNDLFTQFGPKQAPPAPKSQPQQQTSATNTPASQPPVNAPSGPRADITPGSGRKRTFNDGFQGEQEQENGAFQNRAMKTPRRGGRGGGRGDFTGGHGHQMNQMYPGQQYGQQQYPQQQQQGFPMMSGFPQFDPNDPMAAMMSMQGMQGMGFSQMPGMPMPGMPGGPGQPGAEDIPKSNQRCPFYDTQGICYLGNTCPYQHGETGANNSDGSSFPIHFSHIVTNDCRI